MKWKQDPIDSSCVDHSAIWGEHPGVNYIIVYEHDVYIRISVVFILHSTLYSCVAIIITHCTSTAASTIVPYHAITSCRTNYILPSTAGSYSSIRM